MQKEKIYKLVFFIAVLVAWAVLLPKIKTVTKIHLPGNHFAFQLVDSYWTPIKGNVYDRVKRSYSDTNLPEHAPAGTTYKTYTDAGEFTLFASGLFWTLCLIFGVAIPRITNSFTRFTNKLFLAGVGGKIGFWVGVIMAFDVNGSLYWTGVLCALGTALALLLGFGYEKLMQKSS